MDLGQNVIQNSWVEVFICEQFLSHIRGVCLGKEDVAMTINIKLIEYNAHYAQREKKSTSIDTDFC